MNSIALISIALFIMAGGIMERGKIGEKLINLVDLLVGRIKGGLGVVGTISCAVFGSITGSACATLSCIGSIMFPRLEEAGYPRGIAAAVMSNASLLGMLIPPNSTLIIFAWIGGQSILACFLATVIPGIIMTALICLVNCWLVKDNPNVKVTEPVHGKEKFQLFKKRGIAALPALMLPVIVLGGIYGGIMTPTEAAAVAVVYAIPTGMFIYKGLTLRGLWDSLVESAVTTGVVMVMLYSVMMLSRLYILEDLPSKMLGLFRAVSDNRWIILFMINIFLVVMGMLMDDISSVTLTTPILMPIIIELGFNPIHYAAIVGVNTGLGCITPPAAPVLYLGGRLGNAPINEMMSPNTVDHRVCMDSNAAHHYIFPQAFPFPAPFPSGNTVVAGPGSSDGLQEFFRDSMPGLFYNRALDEIALCILGSACERCTFQGGSPQTMEDTEMAQ